MHFASHAHALPSDHRSHDYSLVERPIPETETVCYLGLTARTVAPRELLIASYSPTGRPFCSGKKFEEPDRSGVLERQNVLARLLHRDPHVQGTLSRRVIDCSRKVPCSNVELTFPAPRTVTDISCRRHLSSQASSNHNVLYTIIPRPRVPSYTYPNVHPKRTQLSASCSRSSQATS